MARPSGQPGLTPQAVCPRKCPDTLGPVRIGVKQEKPVSSRQAKNETSPWLESKEAAERGPCGDPHLLIPVAVTNSGHSDAKAGDCKPVLLPRGLSLGHTARPSGECFWNGDTDHSRLVGSQDGLRTEVEAVSHSHRV